MRYYTLKNANDPNITGNVYPQISSHKGWCWENYSFLSQLKPNVLPREHFVLDYLVLDKKAKLTNFLSDGIIIWGFIIDQTVKKTFDDSILPIHKYFEVHIQWQGQVLQNYYWFYPVCEIYSNLDFKNSTFQITNKFLSKEIIQSEIIFNNVDEIRDYENKNSGHRVHPKSIRFINNINFDLFQIGAFSFDWIISERMKKRLIESDVNGYEIREIDWLK